MKKLILCVFTCLGCTVLAFSVHATMTVSLPASGGGSSGWGSGGEVVGGAAGPSLSTQSTSVSVISPNGGEVWEVGKQYTIRWQGTIQAIYLGQIRGLVTDIVNHHNIPDASGSFSWTIPQNTTPGSYYIEVAACCGAPVPHDSSDGVLNIIVSPPSLPVPIPTPTQTQVPPSNNDQTLQSLLDQIKALQDQLSHLQPSPSATPPVLPIPSPSTNEPSDTGGAVNACVSLTSSLTYRSRDASTNGDVSALQDFLQAKGYLSSEPTGFFGIATLQAVKKMQSDNHINPTGFVGALTRAKIKELSCP